MRAHTRRSAHVARVIAVGSGSLPVNEFMAAAPNALFVVELDDSEGDLVEAVGASREFLVGSAG